MNRYLLIDIGAGTMDILYHQEPDINYKAVVKSPVLLIEQKTASIKEDVFIDGNEMGGGRLKSLLKSLSCKKNVVMTKSASATISHDLKKVEAMGIKTVSDKTNKKYESYKKIHLADIDHNRIQKIVEGFGVDFAFDIIGICAQDHGRAPKGISNLDFRHEIFSQKLKERPLPEAFLHSAKEVPSELNRLCSIAKDAQKLPAKEVYVMDSAMAAICGAALDIEAADKEKIIVVDAATSHTVCAALEKGMIAGFFEYHTRDINTAILEDMIKKLLKGNLNHKQILKEGGHGAYVRKIVGIKNIEAFILTGPKRGLIKDFTLPFKFGAPLGDNMMTGTAGLLKAIKYFKSKGR